jgi:hypothetical protein
MRGRRRCAGEGMMFLRPPGPLHRWPVRPVADYLLVFRASYAPGDQLFFQLLAIVTDGWWLLWPTCASQPNHHALPVPQYPVGQESVAVGAPQCPV